MKPILLLAAMSLIGAAGAYAGDGHDHGHDHAPRHGGVVSAVKDLDLELVAKPTRLQLYLREHGKPVGIAGAKARLTLLTDSDRREIELHAAGDRLEATGNFNVAPGAKALALVTLPGRPALTARFMLK
jgi:hypothetical protein